MVENELYYDNKYIYIHIYIFNTYKTKLASILNITQIVNVYKYYD